MKDCDELRGSRITTNLCFEIGDEVKRAADRIGISKSEFIRLLLEDEIERIKSVNHLYELRRRA